MDILPLKKNIEVVGVILIADFANFKTSKLFLVLVLDSNFLLFLKVT